MRRTVRMSRGLPAFLPAVLATMLLAGLQPSRALDDAALEREGRRSGTLYLSPETRLLQDDDFLNPATFAVERGEALWTAMQPGSDRACGSCHEPSSMRGVAARYPAWDAGLGRVVDLTGRINDERARRLGLPPLGYEAADMLALTAWLGHLSKGMPIEVDIDGPARPWFEEGKAFFFARRGQLNIACAQCHDDLAGHKLRGDTISQGQINGFPIYRLIWRAVASRHRMFEWCNTSLRAEPYPAGSRAYVALELYLAWRGRGLPVEAPAVRR
jgi:L-cysteine S-thiosulfotransferase